MSQKSDGLIGDFLHLCDVDVAARELKFWLVPLADGTWFAGRPYGDSVGAFSCSDGALHLAPKGVLKGAIGETARKALAEAEQVFLEEKP